MVAVFVFAGSEESLHLHSFSLLLSILFCPQSYYLKENIFFIIFYHFVFLFCIAIYLYFIIYT